MVQQFEMRAAHLVEAGNMVDATERIQFSSENQNHLLRAVETDAAAEVQNPLVHDSP
jgi:hypothetical protein